MTPRTHETGNPMKPDARPAVPRRRTWLVAFALVFVAVAIGSFALGDYPISLSQLFHAFASKVTGASADNTVQLVVFSIRLPRILAGALVGAGLSVAGAAFQGLFRNPMASPDILGASAGAGFGAALMIFLGMGFAMVSVSAFIGGVIAVGAAYLVSVRARRSPILGMVLAGIMIGSLFNAATSYIKLVADPNNVLPSITFWLMGNLSNVKPTQLAWAAVPVLAGMVVLFASRWKLNLLTMGDEEAQTMGVNIKVIRVLVVAAATLITSACVSISGLIGWVGLVIPHFARMIVGDDNRYMMPVSMLMGASFMVLVDDLARCLTTAEIPIGILTAFVGAPFFLYLILRRGGRL
ncbi:MAG: iron ABC transporter permease [Propionibacteriaceae bacterium]|nr:iron ABC transporter permease [Propionibacteriaceae bacterium]